jgi:hypothetical protein
MGTHTMVVTLDAIEQAKLDAGELVLPEHPDSHTWHIRCDDPAHCTGYSECIRMHICKHGHDAVHGFDEDSDDGPCPGHDDPEKPNCFAGEEEYQFHGEWHTYRWGWGWTVPFIGCIVSENWDGDLLDVAGGVSALPLGEHPVDEEWYDDTGVSLTLDAAA